MKIICNFIPADPLRFLRFLNVCFSFAQNSILEKFIKFSSIEKMNILKLLIIFLPINFFYGFLFYTDTLSLLLIEYYFYLNIYSQEEEENSALNSNIRKRFFLAGLSCVFLRQNNIIWINIFPLAECIDQFILKENLIFFNLNFFNTNLISVAKKILRKYSHIALIDIIFIGFFILNKFSIVLGDKTNHGLVLHLAQINHLMIFFLFFFPYVNLISLKFVYDSIRNFCAKKLVKFLITFSLVGLVVLFFDKFSYYHEFLYSDNRHYSFYYFSKIYMNLFLRYSVLFYVAFTFAVIITENRLLFSNPLFWAWLICTILALIPAKLFEFRYFTPCYVTFLLLMHSNFPSVSFNFSLNGYLFNKFNILWSVFLNVVTIYIFLYKPYNNNGFYGISRFMW